VPVEECVGKKSYNIFHIDLDGALFLKITAQKLWKITFCIKI
jgi:hypothetical protein